MFPSNDRIGAPLGDSKAQSGETGAQGSTFSFSCLSLLPPIKRELRRQYCLFISFCHVPLIPDASLRTQPEARDSGTISTLGSSSLPRPHALKRGVNGIIHKVFSQSNNLTKLKICLENPILSVRKSLLPVSYSFPSFYNKSYLPQAVEHLGPIRKKVMRSEGKREKPSHSLEMSSQQLASASLGSSLVSIQRAAMCY